MHIFYLKFLEFLLNSAKSQASALWTLMDFLPNNTLASNHIRIKGTVAISAPITFSLRNICKYPLSAIKILTSFVSLEHTFDFSQICVSRGSIPRIPNKWTYFIL